MLTGSDAVFNGFGSNMREARMVRQDGYDS